MPKDREVKARQVWVSKATGAMARVKAVNGLRVTLKHEPDAYGKNRVTETSVASLLRRYEYVTSKSGGVV